MTTSTLQPDHAGMQARSAPSTSPPGGPLLDAGWLLLIPGIALVALTLILPAIIDRDAARFYRDRLSLVEEHRNKRTENYSRYLESVKRGDAQTVYSLAAVNLNMAPEGMALMVPAGDIARKSASVFEALEPPAVRLPERPADAPVTLANGTVIKPDHLSTLELWSIDPRSRVWLLLAGATLIFLGILPPARST